MKYNDKNIIILNEVDSTNNYAKQLIADKVEEGTVVLAHYQKNGKGQQGNFWESEPNKNLSFSLILYPNWLGAGKQFFISKVVSLALVEVLKTKVENVSIKWPNDIYLRNKKIAGILIENSIKGATIDSTIIGVGLNVNQEIFVSNAPNPVSLKQITDKNFEVEDVLNEFLNAFYSIINELQIGLEQKIDKAYFSNLFRKNEWSKYLKDGKQFEARIIGIGDFGQLQLEEKTGQISEFMFKEVEFVI